ncbi:MAG: hypothetical protein M1833_006486 [Piccolia ochrophora]|nr:MAG: hypothetical protein M1833_006486 [Piccolia ochrophora]
MLGGDGHHHHGHQHSTSEAAFRPSATSYASHAPQISHSPPEDGSFSSSDPRHPDQASSSSPSTSLASPQNASAPTTALESAGRPTDDTYEHSSAQIRQPPLPHPPSAPPQYSASSQFPSASPYGPAATPAFRRPGESTDSPGSCPPHISSHYSSRSVTHLDSPGPSCIKIRDLSHIQQLASEDRLQARAASRRARRDVGEVDVKYEISTMPVTDIIEMVAGLLTKITTTNDRQHENLHRPMPPAEGTAGLSPQTSSVLAFHGKNVPTITILSYLSRIHKYCPTTYEVFLSLLVYFDRMTERINSAPSDSGQFVPPPSNSVDADMTHRNTEGTNSSRADATMTSGWSEAGSQAVSIPSAPSSEAATSQQSGSLSDADSFNLSSFFVVDSFNIHRLVIAGVTCASKFFSDVFYTNSRYAKVGGLPLVELNHLEVQFLLLNEFRLSIPVEELEAYGTMLVEFYAREVMAQRQSHPMEGIVEAGETTQTPTPP